jgi:hypothetical protein
MLLVAHLHFADILSQTKNAKEPPSKQTKAKVKNGQRSNGRQNAST